MNDYREEVARFGEKNGLVGILTLPAENGGASAPVSPSPARPAVLILTAGLLHRAGPNRLYVKIARRLAHAGFVVLRFDFSGIGDSLPRADNLPLPVAAPLEVADAMNYLIARGLAENFILVGHCSGALVSLLASQKDARVAAIALINPEGGDQRWTEYDRIKKESQYYANYYGRDAMQDRDKWRRVLTGKASYGKIASNLVNGVFLMRLRALRFRLENGKGASSEEASAENRAMAEEHFMPLLGRGGAMLLLFSSGSSGLAQWRAQLGPELPRMEREYDLQLHLLTESDHLITPVAAQQQVCREIEAWATQFVLQAATPDNTGT